MHSSTLISLLVAMMMYVNAVNGHGYLMDPPSRSSMWRYGFHTPANYDDNQLFCGGFDVKVKITASHKGYFEFRLCPHNNPRVPVTQDCLNRYLLHQPSGSTQYKELGRPQVYTVTLKLPQGVTCTQCVLQWKYNTGNSYGEDAYGRTCLGCGRQEQFYGCADISIGSTSASGSFNNHGASAVGPVIYNSYSSMCTATHQFRAIYPNADQYCRTECRKGHCPQGYCNTSCRSLYQG
ncbi:hypothetical protein FSP39_007381 [Pinctada imbricata]|uniref:Chitin-binding type-4 domain-containing protein n=1 Tax=Pinctada imbricata TaxID=66713 RepID=A0AA89BVK1_PINIB|nr:hypothetical protein FSP39_007381 [Pinctada imbricata]